MEVYREVQRMRCGWLVDWLKRLHDVSVVIVVVVLPSFYYCTLMRNTTTSNKSNIVI